MTKNSDSSNAAMTGEIILLSSRIERNLHLLTSAEVIGIHPLTEMAGDKLSSDVKRKLHYIATIRNQAAHENDFFLSNEEFEKFKSAAYEVLNILESMTANTAENAAAQSQDDENVFCDIEVEKELFAHLATRIRVLGYYPVVGSVYLLYAATSALLKNWVILLLSIFYVCSLLLSIKGGVIDGDKSMLYAGIGSFIFSYTTVVVSAFRKPLFKNLHKAFYLIPVLNIIYLLLRWLKDVEWAKFLTAFTGICCFCGTIILAWHCLWVWALITLLASWIISVICCRLWGKKREE